MDNEFDLEYQVSIVDKLIVLMQNMTVGTHKTRLSFQKGVIMINISLQKLYIALSPVQI